MWKPDRALEILRYKIRPVRTANEHRCHDQAGAVYRSDADTFVRHKSQPGITPIAVIAIQIKTNPIIAGRDPVSFDRQNFQYFAEELEDLREMEEAGLLQIDDQWISVLPAGRMLVRAIAMVFDRYLRADRERTRYSKVI